jgi:HTH-type transcriptional regulator / antitoxin HipB
VKSLAQISTHLQSRRRKLALNQQDMHMKIGMPQQQYQRIEAGGDTRVSTLLRVIEGLGLELMLVPQEHAKFLAQWVGSEKNMQSLVDAINTQEPTSSAWANLLRDLED